MTSTRLTIASVALALVATLSSTGCYRHRYRVVYAYRVPVMAEAPPPVAYAAPPPPAAYAPPPPAYPAMNPGAGQPVIIRTQSAATIVVNPPRPGPTTVQVMPAQSAPIVAPQVQPAQPAPMVPQGQQDPSWFDNE
jgi:hypothetical protein